MPVRILVHRKRRIGVGYNSSFRVLGISKNIRPCQCIDDLSEMAGGIVRDCGVVTADVPIVKFTDCAPAGTSTTTGS
jgi:hypothetical protein